MDFKIGYYYTAINDEGWFYEHITNKELAPRITILANDPLVKKISINKIEPAKDANRSKDGGSE